MGAGQIRLAEPRVLLEIYYGLPEIGNAEIRQIFGLKSDTAVRRYKLAALDLMKERGEMRYCQHSVRTETAFDAWGIDIAEVERRYNKLRKLGFVSNDGAGA